MIITAQNLLELMPLVAHRNFRPRRENGDDLRDEKGFCPICALVDELYGWDGDPVDAWWAIEWLQKQEIGGRLALTEHEQFNEISLFVHWADNYMASPQSGHAKLRHALGVKP